MTRNFIGHCFLQWFLIKTVTAQMPAAKYIQMGNMAPVRPNVPSIPSVPMQYPNPTISSLLNYLPNYSNLPTIPNLPMPFTNFQNVPNPPVKPMIPPQISPMPYPLPSNMKVPMPPRNFFDPTVMNNLAIALHLLILSNLLHPSEAETKPPALPDTSAPAPQTPTYPTPPQTYPSQPIQGYFAETQEQPAQFPPPSSKFLGSSGFVEPPISSLMGAPVTPNYNTQNSNPRINYNLKSPYEALGPGPQGNDVFAQYGPQNLKADFQSPYNSIMANDNASKDLFNMF